MVIHNSRFRARNFSQQCGQEIYVGWHGKDSGGQERSDWMKENCLFVLVELVKFLGSFLMVIGYGVL